MILTSSMSSVTSYRAKMGERMEEGSVWGPQMLSNKSPSFVWKDFFFFFQWIVSGQYLEQGTNPARGACFKISQD